MQTKAGPSPNKKLNFRMFHIKLEMPLWHLFLCDHPRVCLKLYQGRYLKKYIFFSNKILYLLERIDYNDIFFS